MGMQILRERDEEFKWDYLSVRGIFFIASNNFFFKFSTKPRPYIDFIPNPNYKK
jgi:hypothetical protein